MALQGAAVLRQIMPTIVEVIRSRTRSEWRDYVRERFTDARIWVQEHGEKAAFLTFFVGLFIALFFKLFIFLVVVGIIAGYIVWFMASEEKGGGGASA